MLLKESEEPDGEEGEGLVWDRRLDGREGTRRGGGESPLVRERRKEGDLVLFFLFIFDLDLDLEIRRLLDDERGETGSASSIETVLRVERRKWGSEGTGVEVNPDRMWIECGGTYGSGTPRRRQAPSEGRRNHRNLELKTPICSRGTAGGFSTSSSAILYA